MAMADFFNQVTLETVRKAYEYMGYAYFEKGDYNLNIFGIRNNILQSNAFNDVIGVTYKINGVWHLNKYGATTDPGRSWLIKLMNDNGTAIMIPGQYRGVYGIGLHKQKYEALRQKKPIKYWRDKNCDGKLDLGGKVYEEIAYTNIHRATNNPGQTSVQIDLWSAGCQVIGAYNDFAEFMLLAHKAKKIFGDSFTYTLFTEDNFFCKNKELISPNAK